MEWLAVVAIVAVGFFLWQGFRTRCPQCGTMALHPKDREAMKEQKDFYELMKTSGLLDSINESGLGTAVQPGYVNAPFRCKSCGHKYQRKAAIEWLTISNKIGDERAVAEYRKHQVEMEQRRTNAELNQKR